MGRRRVFLLGRSVYAEGLIHLLAAAVDDIDIVGRAETFPEAQEALEQLQPDVIILADMILGDTTKTTLGELLTAQPDLPIIHANLSANHVQVITSQRLSARSSDLLTVIAELPARREPSAPL